MICRGLKYACVDQFQFSIRYEASRDLSLSATLGVCQMLPIPAQTTDCKLELQLRLRLRLRLPLTIPYLLSLFCPTSFHLVPSTPSNLQNPTSTVHRPPPMVYALHTRTHPHIYADKHKTGRNPIPTPTRAWIAAHR